uniref:pblB n=1 Tax=uncultured Streptococcus sp. TaxID=83427 RepID=UPI002595A6BE
MVSFNEAMLSNDRTLAIRVGDFTSENIKTANFKYGYITGDDFTPGGTYAGTASILFTSIVESFKKLDVVYPEIGLLVGSKVEWVKMGKYYIDDIKIDRNANTTEIELMDEMFKLNESFKTDLKYPAQIRDVILEVATKTGVTLATDDFGTTAIQQHVDEPTGDKLTYRDVLSQASQLLGFSCFFNRNGELEVRGLTESGITITADNYFLHGLEKSEVEYQIAGITCETKDDEVLTVGLQTGRSLEIENPLATQDTLNALYYALKDITYYPYDLSYQGHLKLDVGQWVTIKTNKDEVFKVPVLYQSFSFSGGLTSTISADSVAGSDAQYTYGSFVTKKIDQKSTRIQAEVQQQLKYADEEFKKVSNEMLQQSLEYQNSVRNELATSKAELETQIDTAKTQAELNAKTY